jgi:hypothetical protein
MNRSEFIAKEMVSVLVKFDFTVRSGDRPQMVFGGRLGCAINSSFTNTQPRCDLRPGEPFCAQRGNPMLVGIDPGSAELLSLRSCVMQSSLHALDNQAALQFGNGAENSEDQLAGGRAGVELLRE